jgi:SWI/SNF-related matrix-associated actin-dependent regulator of chromatin subfamily D
MEASRGHKRKISFADLEATFRRAGPLQHAPPPPQQQAQMSQAQMDQARLEHQRRTDHARRMAKKPTDREIPEDLSDVIVGDGVERYKKLRDVERRLDAVMMRKRLDINDNTQRQYTRREGVLRIWVSNTAEGQPWQFAEEGGVGFGEDGTFDFGENSQATFRVKIEGRLLPDSAFEKESTEEEKKEDKTRRPRLSHFFKSITIRFDRNPALQPDGYSAIEWHKPVPGSPNYDPNGSEVSFDTLEFERKSDESMNVTIELVRDVKTERFKLSPQLADILDTDEEDRAGAVQGIWEYCRAMGLQEDEDRRHIVCDEPLRKVRNQTLQSRDTG